MKNYDIVNDSESLEKAIARAKKAQKEFAKYSQEEVDKIFFKAALAANQARIPLAKLAVEETGMGVVEDKVIKNHFASEYIYNKYKNAKTCGVLEEDKAFGIKKIAEPIGIIAAVIPTTNPTSTAIFKTLIALKTRNAIIISPHPRAKKCTIEAAKIVLEAAVEAGAPEGIISWIDVPSLELTNMLMSKSDTILATGGPGMVKAAYSSGKPALGVGAGNTPAIIDKSANIVLAVNSIIHSKTFDNGMICASEQSVIVMDSIYDKVKEEFKERGCYFLNDEEIEKVRKTIIIDGSLNAKIVGQTAYTIAKLADVEVPESTKILIGEVENVDSSEEFAHEKLSPVLAILKAKSTDDGIAKAAAMVEFNGLGHSAAIHTEDHEISKKFGHACKAIRIIENAPSTFGGIGSVYNAFIPSLTLGCGSYGHNSVSNNVSAVNLINIKRIGRRNNNMQWVKLPPKVYFEKNSIRYLRDMKHMEKAMIVTDRSMVNLGYVEKIEDVIRRRRNHVDIELFFDVEPDPSIDTVREGVELMRKFEPDCIIALGGGSSMDAAKVMWLMYENPEVNFDDIKQKFMDIRKRAFKFPELGKKAKMICIPTTSGTGSEVTPFAVITDKKENKKYPLTDYALTPTIAIVDPEFVMSLPGAIAADTGIDVLTHAVEAYVSILASDFTDGWAKQAVKLVFEYLEESVKKGTPIAREKMHNAATIAGMAFANAFLGMNHSLAHKIGGEWHIPHGRTNGILLPHVIRYNGTIPTKLNIWPKIENYKADVKFMELAQLIGLNPKTPAEGVEMFADACEELCHKVGVASNVESQGISREAWEESVHRIAMNAYEDQCTPANPRMPMVKDMEDILRKIYDYKNKFDK